MNAHNRGAERLARHRAAAISLIAIVPILMAAASLAVLISAAAGRDQLFRTEPLALETPIRLEPKPDDEIIGRVYELLARGVGPNDPIFYRHPITTGGELREVGLLYVAAGESDGDLLRLLGAKGLDISEPINAVAVCAAVLAKKSSRLLSLLDELGADPNPEPRCNDSGDSPLTVARRHRNPEIFEILMSSGALDDY